MSHLFTCQNLTHSFGAQVLFRGINLVVSEGDRIGLIGPNGSGKSTLLKIIAGLVDSDEGELLSRRHLRISYLAQSDELEDEQSIARNLEAPLLPLGLDDAERHVRVQSLLSRAEFPDPGCSAGQLSGGWRKRLAICRSLIVQPDLLVMDEPTNHLDLEGILWLENLLAPSSPESPAAFVLVSHDRLFLEHCVSRVVELSAVYPDGSFQVSGNYSQFLEEHKRFLELQAEQEDRLSNKVRRENEWLSRGPKARATKARYRIDAAHRLQDELSSVKGRNRALSSVQMGFEGTGRKTRKLLEAEGLSRVYAGRTLFADLDLVLTPGSRLGLLGRNGCGKSTLMEILAAAGDEKGPQPDTGRISLANGLHIVSFDQRRTAINPELTLRRALAPDGDSVIYQGRSVHVVSWAQRFLFRPDQLETPVGRLSGGEQARILLADIMRQPADILLLDEPTNDLDIPSLEVLEESLLEFPGALVLVSHDRFLLDRVCDRILGFDSQGGVEFFADYNQWLAALAGAQELDAESVVPVPAQPASREKKKQKGRLSYMEQREYDGMEERILQEEERRDGLKQELATEEMAADAVQLAACWQKLQDLEAEIEQLYQRWDVLETKKESGV
ncbi:MAG: ABC-F family ATP-binding cassette domain-containing protein [Desulfobulbaceae bacterium]|uniref:ABC-F family ATP-binding cassette domain-containing protein n=1 Tax=Candidatus Desulfatifera sulfidica TaxID=2841691 RepID=A0A8J6TCN3_9BACT|nr:ABC-F family ATP-binding cassette domain-containing protein [Candidatus Desulfatifera sulfidica]